MLSSRANLQSPVYRQKVQKPLQQLNNTIHQQNIKDSHFRLISSNLPLGKLVSQQPNSPCKANCRIYSSNNTGNLNHNLLSNISLDEMHINKINKVPLNNKNYNPPHSQSNLISFHEEVPDHKLNSSRYSSELQQLRKQLFNLKGNFKKLEQQNQILNEQSFKNINHNFKKKQHNLKGLQYNHSDRISTEGNTTSTFNQLHSEMKDYNHQPKYRDKSYTFYSKTNKKSQINTQYASKIDLILKKVSQLQLAAQKGQIHFKQENYEKKNQIEKIQSQEQIYESTLTPLLEKISEKTVELKRTQIRHLALFMGINKPQQSIITPLLNSNVPQQWKIFELQLDTLMYKFEQVIKREQIKKSDQKLHKKNNKWSEQNSIQNQNPNTNEIKKILQQNKLKQEQNQILKLEYLKLKNKSLELEQQYQNVESQLSQYKCLKRQYVYEIQRLQKLVQSQDEKIKTMNALRQKKQDIENQFQKIMDELHNQLQIKQQIIVDLKEKIISYKKDNLEKQIEQYNNQQNDEKYTNPISVKDKQKGVFSFKQNSNQIIQRPSHLIKQLVIQLARLIDLDFNNNCSQSMILKQLISKFKRQKYIEIYFAYLQIIKTFDVDINSSNHYELIVDLVKRQYNNFKLLLDKLEGITEQFDKNESQKQTLKFEIQNLKYQIRQTQKKYKCNQNQKTTILKEEISFDDQSQLLYLNSKTWDLSYHQTSSDKNSTCLETSK